MNQAALVTRLNTAFASRSAVRQRYSRSQLTDCLNRVFAEHYAAKKKSAKGQKEFQWITIGGQPEGDKQHAGGFPVAIDGQGNIVHSAVGGLQGKHVSDVKGHFDDQRKGNAEPSKESKADENPKQSQDDSTPITNVRGGGKRFANAKTLGDVRDALRDDETLRFATYGGGSQWEVRRKPRGSEFNGGASRGIVATFEAAEQPQDTAPQEAPLQEVPQQESPKQSDVPLTIENRNNRWFVSADTPDGRFVHRSDEDREQAIEKARKEIEGMGFAAAILERETPNPEPRQRPREFSDQEIAYREQERTFAETVADPAKASEKDLRISSGYFQHLIRHTKRQLQRGEISQEMHDSLVGGLTREADWIDQLLRDRINGRSHGPEDQTRAEKIAEEAFVNNRNLLTVAKSQGLTMQEYRNLKEDIDTAYNEMKQIYKEFAEGKPTQKDERPSPAREKAQQRQRELQKEQGRLISTADTDKAYDQAAVAGKVPPKLRTGLSSDASVTRKQIWQATGKEPWELTGDQFSSIVDPHNARWRVGYDDAGVHRELVMAGLITNPDSIPNNVLREYANEIPAAMNELMSRNQSRTVVPPVEIGKQSTPAEPDTGTPTSDDPVSSQQPGQPPQHPETKSEPTELDLFFEIHRKAAESGKHPFVVGKEHGMSADRMRELEKFTPEGKTSLDEARRISDAVLNTGDGVTTHIRQIENAEVLPDGTYSGRFAVHYEVTASIKDPKTGNVVVATVPKAEDVAAVVKSMKKQMRERQSATKRRIAGEKSQYSRHLTFRLNMELARYAKRKPAAGQRGMFSEEDHPRDEGGQFTKKGTGSASASGKKPLTLSEFQRPAGTESALDRNVPKQIESLAGQMSLFGGDEQPQAALVKKLNQAFATPQSDKGKQQTLFANSSDDLPGQQLLFGEEELNATRRKEPQASGGKNKSGARSGASTPIGRQQEAKAHKKLLNTKSPYFKKWFGDSKVVDENGEPLVVYHGTKSGFHTFELDMIGRSVDHGKLGSGFYFSGSPEIAGAYALLGRATKDDAMQTMPVFLSLQNPLEIDSAEGNLWDKLRDYSAQAGITEDPVIDSSSNTPNQEWSRQFRKELIRFGYDGVILHFPKGRSEYVAFHPSQIKSATGNVGTYDPSHPSINYSRRRYSFREDQHPRDSDGKFVEKDPADHVQHDIRPPALTAESNAEADAKATESLLNRVLPTGDLGEIGMDEAMIAANRLQDTAERHLLDLAERAVRRKWLQFAYDYAESVIDAEKVSPAIVDELSGIFRDFREEFGDVLDEAAYDALPEIDPEPFYSEREDGNEYGQLAFDRAGFAKAMAKKLSAAERAIDKQAVPKDMQAEIRQYVDEFVPEYVRSDRKRKYSRFVQQVTEAYAKSLADARADVNRNPSDSQKEAGNYSKGHFSWNGLGISIENPVGSVRRGKEWSQTMAHDYGYFKRTEGKDGDQVDVFIGDDLDSDLVFVVNQEINGKFDEHKVIIGASNEDDAKEIYLANYPDDWEGLGSVVSMTIEQFKEWVGNRKGTRKPAEQYAKRNPAAGQKSLFREEDHPRNENGQFASPGDRFTSPGLGTRREFDVELKKIDGPDAYVNFPDQDKWHTKIPTESLTHYRNDLMGVVTMPDTVQLADIQEQPIRDVVSGKATMIGKGNDGIVFDAGDKIVKVSTVVPFHPLGQGGRTIQQSMDHLRQEFSTAKAMHQAGVTGIPKMQLRAYGDKAFIVRDKLDIPEKLTRNQLDQVRKSIESAHKAGFAFSDEIQVGIGSDGNVYHFDMGSAMADATERQQMDDYDYLSRLYEKNGHELTDDPRFVNKRKYEESGWKTVGGAPVYIGDDGEIKKGCPGLKGEMVEDLIDEPEHSRDRRQHKQDVAESQGLEGHELSLSEAKKLTSTRSQAAHQAIKNAAARAEASRAALIASLQDALEITRAQATEREEIKRRARQLTGLTAGSASRLENQYRDYSSIPHFDEAATTLASEYPGHFSGDNPSERLWELLREGAGTVPTKWSPETIDTAAEIARGTARMRTRSQPEADDDLSFDFGANDPDRFSLTHRLNECFRVRYGFSHSRT